MTIQLVRGDLLKSDAHALLNTVNCVGVMGKGIALAFKQRYPAMFDDYVGRCARGEVLLGAPYAVDGGDGHLVVNFPSKGHWRSSSKLEDVAAGLTALPQVLDDAQVRSLAMPAPGCGLGGLDWADVEPLIAQHLGGLSMRVLVYPPSEVHVVEPQPSLFA